MPMDLNALMGAAAQDPKAAAFLQQLLSGGTGMLERMPEIAPQSLRAPSIAEMPDVASMPVFQPAKDTLDDLIGRWSPPEEAQAGDPAAAGAATPTPDPAAGGAAAGAGDPGMIGQMQGPEMSPEIAAQQAQVAQQAQMAQPEEVDPQGMLGTLIARMMGGG